MKRIQLSTLLIAVLSSVSLLACGGDGSAEETFGQTEAMASWDGTQDVILRANTQVAIELQQFADANATDAISGSLSSFQVDFTFTNPKGPGSAHVTGTGSQQGATYVLDLNLAIADWDVSTVSGGLVDTLATDPQKPIDLALTLEKLWPVADIAASFVIDGEVIGSKTTKLGDVKKAMPIEVRLTLDGTTLTNCGVILTYPLPGGLCPAS